MEYIKIDEAAEKWKLSPRNVQMLCAKGKINGARRFGRAWMIPRDAERPIDGRSKQGRAISDEALSMDMPLPRKTPFLYMTDLYHTPGTADAVGEALSYNHEAQVLFEAEVAYSRGQIDKVYDSANYLLNKHSGFNAVLSAGMLLAMCAIWKGDIEMWRKAKIHISEAPAKRDLERDAMQLAISAVDIMLYSVESFPEWFKIGCFDPLHKDALPAASVYYAKYLYATGYALATGVIKIEGMQGLSLMSMIPHTIEPMISWVSSNNTVLSEIYLRMTCASVYHTFGNDDAAVKHIDRAIKLALPDQLYGLLAEYGRALGSLLEERLAIADAEALVEVKRLHKCYNEGWSKLSGTVRGKHIITTLTQKQRDVARLASFGMSNKEIADKLNMSLPGVKQAILAVSDKMGVGRDEYAAFL